MAYKYKLQNKIINRTHDTTDIYLTLDAEFPFDITNIFIRHNQTTNKIIIIDERIPENIKQKMLAQYKNDINEYIPFLETNLELFFKNESPKIEPNLFFCDYRGPINLVAKVFTKNVLNYFCKTVCVCVECGKCKKTLTVNTNSAVVCDCHSEIRVFFDHGLNSNNLGYLSFKNCNFVCIANILFVFSCFKCEKSYEKGYQKDTNFNCSDCGTEINVQIEKIEYLQKTDKAKKDVSKKELKGDGTCKHYKKSFRWFLFPCCKKIYPCDDCHNEDSDHAAEIANIMVCGICRKQQNVQKSCDCGMNIKKSSKFWEGGKGMRNKQTMSKKDNKKYKK